MSRRYVQSKGCFRWLKSLAFPRLSVYKSLWDFSLPGRKTEMAEVILPAEKPCSYFGLVKKMYDHKESASEKTLILVLALGFLIRVYACLHTHIINPDGTLYIHQARALYFGAWQQLTSCGLSYLSIYPILVTLAYPIFQDWIVAARSVSVFFGTLTLIPLYFLLRRFFVKETSVLCALIFTLIPFLVGHSADVIRDPVFWFFLMLGLYFFVLQMEKSGKGIFLALASFSFLLAAWARVEALLFILLSFSYLLATKQDKKGQRLMCFLAPPMLALLSAVVHAGLWNIFRLDEIFSKILDPFRQYAELRSTLAALASPPQGYFLESFFKRARNLVWLIALGTLFAHIVKAFFYPAFLVFLAGTADIGKSIREDRRIRYLLLLSFGALVLLYLHILQTWLIYHRFMAVFLFPSFVFVGFGIERLLVFANSRFRLKRSFALALLCFLIFSLSLPKNLKPAEQDKVVFKEIGELIAQMEGKDREIPVAASMQTIRWICFYANLHAPGAPCPQPYNKFRPVVGKGYQEFARNLRDRGIRYFLWEEKHWPKDRFNFQKQLRPEDFRRLCSWYHPDTGRLVLYRVL